MTKTNIQLDLFAPEGWLFPGSRMLGMPGMPQDPSGGEFPAGYVEARLKAAERALMALPTASCSPAGICSFRQVATSVAGRSLCQRDQAYG